MPIPLIIGAVAAAAGIYGAAKGVSGAMDHSNAKDINNDARSLVDSANLKVEEQRKATKDAPINLSCSRGKLQFSRHLQRHWTK
ncbi:hypothetical protein QVM52_11315, partial [Pseudomonas mosselii]